MLYYKFLISQILMSYVSSTIPIAYNITYNLVTSPSTLDLVNFLFKPFYESHSKQ